jgi:beta-aspartyl-peptidase (threonine type)
VLESSEHMMLVGEGAEQFAVEQGISLCDAAELVVPRELAAWERCHKQDHADSHHVHRDHVHQGGTVGAVAVDAGGRVVAGTSTGGTCCKHAGRVGDSPLIGCGCYADGEAGGVSCTGWGEAIMKIVMAKTAVDLLRRESPQRAAQSCVDLLALRTGGTGGLILLDREGTPAAAFNTPNMAWGCVQPDGSFFVSA